MLFNANNLTLFLEMRMLTVACDYLNCKGFKGANFESGSCSKQYNALG